MVQNIKFSSKAERQLKKYRKKRQIPNHALDKLRVWLETVREFGIEEAQKAPKFYDHPLKGQWAGFRSIYLDMTTWRLIYKIIKTPAHEEKVVIEFVEIVEINPHEY